MSSIPDRSTISEARLDRQGLIKPLARKAGFEALFRRLQPVSTGPQVRPGSPPRLTHRTRFDSEAAADELRASRQIVKGRFQGGGVGYVHADDLALYANAFCRPLRAMSEVQEQVYDAIRYGGPLTPAQIKDETGLLKKHINPALQRLQEAFLIFEDQIDDSWDRAWYEFASEWPEIRLSEDERDTAAGQVVIRFLDAFVFATDEQIRDWTQWPAKYVSSLLLVLADLEKGRRVERAEVKGLGAGWCQPQDAKARAAKHSSQPPGTPYLLNRGDFLSRAHKSELDRRFGKTDVLQFVYSGGEFVGAVRGHWGFKPFDIEDVEMALPNAQSKRLRAEVLDLVRSAYPEPRHNVLRYAGKAL